MLLGVALFFGFMFAVNFLAFALFSDMFDGDGHRGPWPFVPILAVGLVVAFFFAGRAVRGMAGRVGDVMEAADRVASGDYTVRLSERGPGEMRRLARSFNAMTGRLRASEEQRRNLLADLAHELRTPLSVIQGNLEGMLDGLYASDRSHIQPVLEETKVMARLLDDLQTLSRAEAGALRLYRETIQPDELVADAVAAFGPRASAEGVRLARRVTPGLPSVDVDPVRIAEVFANLLLNALQHTPPSGTVVVSASRSQDGRVSFEVADTGPGIPPETLPHVFDRFVKAAHSGGAGLGLAIAKSLVEAHGGEIVAESPPGGGTTMRFVLPVAG
jgi:two-component system OmpR family sensor kinase/two-component system sensor histidine kinase BaeS